MTKRKKDAVPKPVKRLFDLLQQAAERIKKDKHDRDRQVGEHHPEHGQPTGTCVVCQGLVKAKVVMRPLGPLRMGGVNNSVKEHKGWHCTKCGLKYEFPPKPLNDE